MNEGAILKRLGLFAKTSRVRGEEYGNCAVLKDEKGKVRYRAVDPHRTQAELVTELVAKALADSKLDPAMFLPEHEQAEVRLQKLEEQVGKLTNEITAQGARITQLCEAMNAKATTETVDRKAMMQMLDEKGIEYPKNISNEKLQALAAEHGG